MWIAVQGCLHGELDCVYAAVREAEAHETVSAVYDRLSGLCDRALMLRDASR